MLLFVSFALCEKIISNIGCSQVNLEQKDSLTIEFPSNYSAYVIFPKMPESNATVASYFNQTRHDFSLNGISAYIPFQKSSIFNGENQSLEIIIWIMTIDTCPGQIRKFQTYQYIIGQWTFPKRNPHADGSCVFSVSSRSVSVTLSTFNHKKIKGDIYVSRKENPVYQLVQSSRSTVNEKIAEPFFIKLETAERNSRLVYDIQYEHFDNSSNSCDDSEFSIMTEMGIQPIKYVSSIDPGVICSNSEGLMNAFIAVTIVVSFGILVILIVLIVLWAYKGKKLEFMNKIFKRFKSEKDPIENNLLSV